MTPDWLWIDSHAHCAEESPRRLQQILDAARDAGVGMVVNTATSLADVPVLLEQASRHDMLVTTAGVSPFDCTTCAPDWDTSLEAYCARREIVAVGETGIDGSNPRYPPLAQQRRFFERHLDIARTHALPAVIHSRGCESEAVDICRSIGVEKALFHCFTGNCTALKKVLDAGYTVSFSGIITFPGASLDEQVRYTPLDRMLVETDSPYLAPVPYRGQRNQPAWVCRVGERAAALHAHQPDAFAKILRDTFSRLFSVNPFSGDPGASVKR